MLIRPPMAISDHAEPYLSHMQPAQAILDKIWLQPSLILNHFSMATLDV